MATDQNNNLLFQRHNVGIRNVGSYQVSGWPWITGSAIALGVEHQVTFPYVPKSFSITISGSGATPINVHFDSTSSSDNVMDQHHYINLATDAISTATFATKCKDFWISSPNGASGYEIIAELTNIPTTGMPTLTGSGITEHEAGSGITVLLT